MPFIRTPRVSLRTLGLALGLVACGDDSELTKLSDAPAEGIDNTLAASGPDSRTSFVFRDFFIFYGRSRDEPSAAENTLGVGAELQTVLSLVDSMVNVVSQTNHASVQTRGNVFGWSIIAQTGAYTVHQSVSLRIRGPTFAVVHDCRTSASLAAERRSGARRLCCQRQPQELLDSHLSVAG
jgi:hypothetical protein